MSLQPEDVDKIALLARLNIEPEQRESLATELTNILDLVDQMNTVDTDTVTPMAHPMDAVQRLREDVVTEGNNREGFQSVAPNVEKGLFLVPRVVE